VVFNISPLRSRGLWEQNTSWLHSWMGANMEPSRWRGVVKPRRAGMLAAHCTNKQLKYVLHTMYSIHLLKHHAGQQKARTDEPRVWKIMRKMQHDDSIP